VVQEAAQRRKKLIPVDTTQSSFRPPIVFPAATKPSRCWVCSVGGIHKALAGPPRVGYQIGWSTYVLSRASAGAMLMGDASKSSKCSHGKNSRVDELGPRGGCVPEEWIGGPARG
jgi:hypothetical protein